MTKIKICGLSRPCDVEAVNEARPDWCGFIIDFPRSRRNCSPDQVRELRRKLRPEIIPVGVFVDQAVEKVAGLLLDGTISAAQLHGAEDAAYLAALRAAAPGFPIWQAFRVRDQADLAAAAASAADLVVLDNGQGTGRAFDWTLAAALSRPYLLAGGLTPENIPEAVRRLRPFGLDLSSGVETDGRKDPEKILAAVRAARMEEFP